MRCRLIGTGAVLLLVSGVAVWAQPPAGSESAREVERLRKAVAGARKQADAVGGRLVPLRTDLQNLERKLNEIEPAKLKSESSEKLEVRVPGTGSASGPSATVPKVKDDEPQKWELPIAREGMKDQKLLIVCRNNKAYTMNFAALADAADKDKTNSILRNGGTFRLALGDYDVLVTHKKINGATYLDLKCLLKDGRTGLPVETALDDANSLMKQLGSLDPKNNTIQFTVYPDSYEVFKKLRGHVYAKGYDVAWSPFSVDQVIMLGSGKAPVQ